MARDYYKQGTWNSVCAVCGFKMKADELIKRWDGNFVCKADWEPRHILDFFKTRPDHQSVPWSQHDTSIVNGYAAITSANSPYTIDATTVVSLDIDATGGNITITLPAATYASGPSQALEFYRSDTSAHTVTIQRAGSDTINGGTSITLSGQNQLRLQTNDVSSWTTF